MKQTPYATLMVVGGIFYLLAALLVVLDSTVAVVGGPTPWAGVALVAFAVLHWVGYKAAQRTGIGALDFVGPVSVLGWHALALAAFGGPLNFAAVWVVIVPLALWFVPRPPSFSEPPRSPCCNSFLTTLKDGRAEIVSALAAARLMWQGAQEALYCGKCQGFVATEALAAQAQ